MQVTQSLTPQDVRVTISGVDEPDLAELLRTKVARICRHTHVPVTSAWVRLSRHGDPAVSRPIVAQANLDLDGRMVRAQVEAVSAHEAVDLLDARLRGLVQRAARHWEARRGHEPSYAAHEWQHDSEPTRRHTWYPRAEAEREVVRHKTFSIARRTVDEAVAELELLDYDFHLFEEACTGIDCVVYRGGPTGLRLAYARRPPHGVAVAAHLGVTVSPNPAPRLTTAQAVERLNLSGMPFCFFRDATTGRRGCVLYHRYDGHYGLITPAAQSVSPA
ncbi:sigma 54 modulation/S30EA ribosomal C-terminal domain-containing protein [Phycicoccus sp. 3266]|uniref:sigma 54 modulation/S30EA ribosomal C-terminal domain-containing protein n=1 Tax=Phycicoccus sp. 3266 TaxID=2817751 RepID=UPI00285A6C22|nr:sigma 54 modulation/S30EA ribosomal C-terminal domain-containing protein [Phycicoccus sp. 3266]MDR6865002.1 ribosome-associated translation inhibitor RaiA [Phycicoccus sp. 3266]